MKSCRLAVLDANTSGLYFGCADILPTFPPSRHSMFFATLPTDDGLIYPLHFPRVLLSQLSSEIMPLEEKAVFHHPLRCRPVPTFGNRVFLLIPPYSVSLRKAAFLIGASLS